MSMNVPSIMTKYEYAKIKGIRLQQLVDGFEPKVETTQNDTVESIFEKELKEKKIPLIITRKIGYEKFVDIKVSDMIINKFH
ncbi:putative DNA directed RNA polymerase K subunit [Aureococcus anophagefferens virus]|uniref:Putative DNA directed RNA polymerase K subunit n=1 Tax=Aureococcus anophagefferens virus TaxID=1474867 RepID=A0A076FI06_9VIRU|nr:putative DNA directed RNA polymerase K subunit [Aureococcus anophagefferens virus]AII17076.1 putative DNA directed RNA polymerase K subunit [Aureococcus anophagefferens virus]UOG94089.1 hypothetical protein MKD35_48 [Aureococcus anophagefferens virus]